MSVIFEAVEKYIVTVEGGYIRDIDDPGGATKYGISQRAYPDLDVVNLTIDQAYKIYERDYWDRYHIGAFKTQDIANKVMLGLINMGDHEVILCLQRAINRCGLFVNIDGILGSLTITAANAAPQFWLLDCLRIEYSKFYLNLVSQRPALIKFFDGWIRRALK